MVNLLWKNVQPEKNGPYNWSYYDTLFGNARSAGLEPIAVIMGNPQWAISSGVPINPGTGQRYDCGPFDRRYLSDFQAFVQAAVTRYVSQVKHWQFWNEPDNQSTAAVCVVVGGCWGGDLDEDGIPDLEQYAEALTYFHDGVKQGNPDAKVLFGAVAYESISQNCFNLSFTDQVFDKLEELSANGNAGDYFDYMNFHQYDAFRDRWDGALPFDQGVLGKAVGPGGSTGPSIRSILEAHGLGNKPMVVSEIGLMSDRSGTQDEFQARHIVHEFVRGMTLWPNDIPAMMVFALRFPNYGIVDSTFNPYPAYYAYQTLTGQLEWGTSFDIQLGPSETGSQYIQAYRFVMPDGSKKLVLWTDDGQKIKRASDLHIDMAIGGVQLDDTWTGRLSVVDEYGVETVIEDGGAGDRDGVVNGAITIQVTQAPVYVKAAP